MNKIEVELYFKWISLTMIETSDGEIYEQMDEDFSNVNVPGTEGLDDEKFTEFVKENIKLIFDGQMDNPDSFESFSVKSIDGPTTAIRSEEGIGLKHTTVTLNVETTEDPDDLDFDDFFHSVIFEIVSEDMTFTFTEFESYYSELK